MRVNPLIAICFAVIAVLVPLTSEARFLQIEDYLEWEWVADPRISPDGKTIVYTRTHVNKLQDRFENELWVMDADGKRNRRLLEKPASGVVWSPDSTRIAYIANTDNGSEIVVRWMDAKGSVTPLTHEGESPSNLSWSPDGKWIAYRARVPFATEPDWNLNLPGKPEGADWGPDAAVVDRLHWRKEGVGIKPEGYNHIFVVSSEGGAPRQVTTGAWHVGEIYAGNVDMGNKKLEWSPDSKSIIFSANREKDADLAVARSYLYAVDVATGTLRRITQKPEFVMKPTISPDGKHIAYIGMENITESNFPTPQLRVVNLDGSNDRVLIADIPDKWSVSLHWSPDSLGLYHVYGKEGAHNLHYVSLDGHSKPITSGAQSLSIASISDRGVAVGTRTTAEAPGDIVRFDLATGRNLQRLTAVNDDVLEEIELGQVEEIWYDSTEDTRIQGWIIYPPNFDPNKKYPLILDIHGGPEAMYISGWFYSTFMFQEWASQGYVLLYTNPRGSSGYGSDFARAIYNAYPGKRDYQDLMHGVDAVIARGFIDEERMYVQGCSGGGTLTAWVVTQTNRFAGAAAMCPIVNMVSFAGSTDIPALAYNRFSKPFWDDPTAWLEHSAIMHVNKVKTPTLLMVGENDLRTTVNQPAEFYTALKLLGVPTKLILLKEEAHATLFFQSGRPSNFLRTQLYLRKWYGEWRRVEGSDGPVWQSTASDQ